jgi:hypothetical protein
MSNSPGERDQWRDSGLLHYQTDARGHRLWLLPFFLVSITIVRLNRELLLGN